MFRISDARINSCRGILMSDKNLKITKSPKEDSRNTLVSVKEYGQFGSIQKVELPDVYANMAEDQLEMAEK